MNIETSGLMALFSGGEALEDLQGTLSRDVSTVQQFAGLLQEQLGLLNKAVEQSATISGNEAFKNVQDFAALIGKKMLIDDDSASINLDETLQTLDKIVASLGDEVPQAEAEVNKLLFQSKKPADSLAVEEDASKALSHEQLLMIGDAGLRSSQVSDNLKPLAELVEEIKTELSEPSLLLKELGLMSNQSGDNLKSLAELVNEIEIERPEPPLMLGDAAVISNLAGNNLKSLSELVDEIATELPEPLLSNAVGKKSEKFSVMETQDKAIAMLSESQGSREESKLVISEKEQPDSLFKDADKKPQHSMVQNALASTAAGDAESTGFSAVAADLSLLNRVVSQDNKVELVPMSRHFAHPEWGGEFADKVVWMHRQVVPAAELNLNPRHLGPISIRIDVSQDQTSVAFVAQHAVVKEAIEAALPRLREMLGEQKLNLVDVNVSQQQSQQRQSGAFEHDTMSKGQQPGMKVSAMSDSAEHDLVDTLTEEIENDSAVAAPGILSLFA
jgi:flagellar hook-length control protein FliK